MDRKILSDLLRDMFERMFWVISCQMCVWHNFGVHISKDVFTSSLRRYISQVVRTIPGAWLPLFFGYVPHKICGGKCAGLVRPKKKAQEYLWSVSLNKFLRYSLDDIFWKVSQMTFLENNCERYSFFLPKKCVKECLRLIFPTFFEVYF